MSDIEQSNEQTVSESTPQQQAAPAPEQASLQQQQQHEETPAAAVPEPAIGHIVHYVLDNGRYPGEHRPAIVVKVVEDEQHEQRVHLQVFTDGVGDFDQNQPGASGLLWREGVRFNAEKMLNSWHYPEG